MYNNRIQTKIENRLKELYKTHDIVTKPMILYSMYNNIRSYFIILDKDNKAQLLNAYSPRIKEENGKLELDSICDSPQIYQEYFIQEFSKNVDYGIYVDEEEIGHYFTDYGEVQIFSTYIQINYTDPHMVREFLNYVKPLPKDVEKTVEYDLVVQTQNGFSTTECSSTRNVDIDIKKNYNDDFPYDKYKKFCEKDGSGLALMYGDPGTGKTTSIKKLIYDCADTNFYIMDFSMLQNIVSGQFLSFLLGLKNAVIIMEDCEYILKRRDTHENPLINSLLNITDGLVGDALNIRFLCTFNAKLTEIDDALLRPGRLKLKYEFKALDKNKTKAICGDDKAETLAEIYNKERIDFGEKKTKKIGF